MTKQELIEELNALTWLNTRIAQKRGHKCTLEFGGVNEIHQRIAKALGYELTQEELSRSSQ